MINKIKLKSEFSRNVLTLITGTTIAQAIPIAVSPILTRLYSPEDFGILAIFLALLTISSSIATARYELAIMLPHDEKEAINIAALAFFITLLVSIFLLLSIVVFKSTILSILNNDKIGPWLYLLPIAVFFVGCFNILNYYNTRNKFYKDIAKAKVVKSFVLAIVPIMLGLLKSGAFGLISGQILSQMFANLKLLKNVIKNKVLLTNISINNIKKEAKKYINFPLYSLPGALANISSTHLVNLLISTFFSVATLGFYSLVQKILGMPSALIGGSIGQVYFEKASKEKNEKGTCVNIYKNTIKKSILIGAIIFIPLYFVIEDIFTFVFGEQWAIAGKYAKIVLPFFYVRFIAATISTTFDIFNALKLELFIQLFLLVGILFILYFFKDKNFINFLYILNIYGISIYIYNIYVTLKLSKGKNGARK